MTKELEKKLLERFNFFHPELSPINDLMCFGFEHGDGWFNIIWNLCEKIEKCLKRISLEDFRVVQVKEKYGTLRFYINYGTDEIYTLIDKAERKSGKICEICGKFGKLNNLGWYKTRCKSCLKKEI
jgi:hypothetical protein